MKRQQLYIDSVMEASNKLEKLMKNAIYASILLIAVCSCSEQTALKRAFEKAGSNCVEWQKVIEHYQCKGNHNSLKLKAALFLIENMDGHGSYWSSAIDTFRHRVYTADSIVDMKQINQWWDELKSLNKPMIRWDLEHLTADFLIGNIDKAFEAWENAPWKDEIDFDLFCHQVLPYRFDTELLADGWRDSLYQAYHPLVAKAKTLKEAFEIVHHAVWGKLLSSSSHFPYTIDVIAMQNQRKAACTQRCVMLGSVMRALAIPAAIDNIGFWGNYSRNNHAWASLVTRKGTYTVYEEEYEAKINNKIDATAFEVNYSIPDDYVLKTDFRKRCSKIWRITYAQNKHDLLDNEWNLYKKTAQPFLSDVSHEYGMNGSVEVKTTLPVERAYLCAFRTGQDWIPICHADIENGKAHFHAIGDSVVYLPMGLFKGKAVALEPPFIWTGHRKIVLSIHPTETETIEINRKYPLTGKWMNEWAPMTGGVFEGSNDADFLHTEVLHRIENMPVFRNIVSLNTNRAYRYIRYVSENSCDTPMAEIEVIGVDGKIKMTPAKSSVKHVELSIDNNTFTRPDIEIGYALGYDLGTKKKPISIIYYPWNDDNFVIPNHEYELFYYDNQWVSLGKRISDGYILRYEDVPKNALLLLKDYTAGKEERPFTYESGKQIWW